MAHLARFPEEIYIYPRQVPNAEEDPPNKEEIKFEAFIIIHLFNITLDGRQENVVEVEKMSYWLARLFLYRLHMYK